MGPVRYRTLIATGCEQVDNVVDGFDRRITVELRLAADPISRRRRRFETDCRKARQVMIQAEHFSHTLPRAVQDEYDQLPPSRHQRRARGGRLPRKINRVVAWIKQHGKNRGALKLAINSNILGKIHPFEEDGVAQTEMGHPAGAKTVLGFARLYQDNEARLRFERFDERTITNRARSPARMARGPILGAIDKPAGPKANGFRGIHLGKQSGAHDSTGLSHQYSRPKGRLVTVATFSFAVAEHPELAKVIQQLVVLKQIRWIFWMTDFSLID